MSLLSKQRTKESFFNVRLSSYSKSTQKQYRQAFDGFENFCMSKFNKDLEEMIPELKVSNTEDVIDFLQEFINQSNANPYTTKVRVNFLNNYLYYRGIKIDSRDLKELKYGKRQKQLKEPLTRKLIQQIIDNASSKKKSLYLTLISTGCRINEAVKLRKKDFVTSSERIRVKIYQSKNNSYRDGFLTTEAERMVRPMLEELSDDDLVFGTNENWQQASESEMQAFRRLVDKTKLSDRYSTKIRTITLHSFRSYCYTQWIKVHNSDLGHAYIGRTQYLDVYLRITPDDFMEKFLMVEPLLLINEAQPESVAIQELRKKVDSQEKTIELLKVLFASQKLKADGNKQESQKWLKKLDKLGSLDDLEKLVKSEI